MCSSVALLCNERRLKEDNPLTNATTTSSFVAHADGVRESTTTRGKDREGLSRKLTPWCLIYASRRGDE